MKEALHLPEGWTFELLPRDPDHVVIHTPPPGRYMVTIDFRLRGFRMGWSTLGPLVSKRKKYSGRGWKQALVDDAVAYLQKEVLR
jgi:hypothetical protein